MKYLYWLGVIAVITGGIVIARSIKFTPQTSTVIPFLQVLTPEEMGEKVFETLKQEIEKTPHLMLGVTPGQIEDLELWRGFLEKAQAQGMKLEVILIEPQLPYVELFQTGVRIDIKAEMGRLVEGLKSAEEKGLKTVTIVPSIYSSQLLPRNPADRLQSEFHLKLLSLSVTKFPLTRPQEKDFEPRCVQGQDMDREGTGPLGCAIVNLARSLYRQRPEPNKLSAQVEKTGLNDYLILLNRNPTTN